MSANFAELYDQLRTREGWHWVEDIVFNATPNINTAQPAGTITSVPVTFAGPDLNLFQQNYAIAAYLVLRKLTIGSTRPVDWRPPYFEWSPAIDNTFAAAASTTGGTVQVSFSELGQPGNNNSRTVGLRRIWVGTPPAGVTITRVQVFGLWASGTFADDLHLTSPVTGFIDLGTYFDSRFGLVNRSESNVVVQFTYNNTNAAITNVPYALYGVASSQNWWFAEVQYQDWNGGLHNIGQYDDVLTPNYQFAIDQLVPVPLTDPGQKSTPQKYGNLVFTTLGRLSFFGPGTVQYNVMLTASVAYLLPYTGG